MIGDINEDDFKRKIQQRDKARQRKGEIRQVLEMYTTVLGDLFQAFVGNSRTSELVESLEELRDHFNTTMTAVSNRYSKCAIPVLTKNFDLH
jgi:hypothetical protein